MEACSCDSKESLAIMQYLLDRKANIHLTDCDGMTALHCVCDNFNQDTVVRKEIVYKLLYEGLSSTIMDKRGRLPICYELHHIDKRNGKEKLDERFSVIHALISSGIGFNLSNKDHRHWLLKSLNSCSPLFQNQLFHIAESALLLSTIKKIHRHSCSVMSDDDDYAKFKAYLHNMTHNPRSLKALCRIVVRDKLDGFILVKSELLPLPQTLKDYLALIG
ncbi:hypothetical protein CHS0354_015814 [Potamilus streckersoni]|uniref:SOCS box domain-containing protein n=1 Tax=Potamilus streckersoni TaxID=2493646 RepID=A0AAE0SE60_9BIVA|nr:hypothetical protein CHS0354_015814 [Potamilus streckersoni]